MLDVESALCAQTDPELFFPDTEASIHQIRQAKAICGECDIRKECLLEALTYNYIDGVWGGTTPRERARLQNPNMVLPYRINRKKARTRNAKGDSQ